jgi:hypothetical protein
LREETFTILNVKAGNGSFGGRGAPNESRVFRKITL